MTATPYLSLHTKTHHFGVMQYQLSTTRGQCGSIAESSSWATRPSLWSGKKAAEQWRAFSTFTALCYANELLQRQIHPEMDFCRTSFESELTFREAAAWALWGWDDSIPLAASDVLLQVDFWHQLLIARNKKTPPHPPTHTFFLLTCSPQAISSDVPNTAMCKEEKKMTGALH